MSFESGRDMVNQWLKKVISCVTLMAFVCLNTGTLYAQALFLPEPGTAVALSGAFHPAHLKGIKIYPDNPLRFDFIVDKGDAFSPERETFPALRDESEKLIKYFLSALTIPEKDLWVNLSPYEKDRIIPDAFGVTGMGRDLLAQDYILKQITSSLMNPDDAVGKTFWKRVYAEAYQKYGTTDIPVDTFNKVWIVPQDAVVYEHNGAAFVVKATLKVMLETDYLAIKKSDVGRQTSDETAVSGPTRFDVSRLPFDPAQVQGSDSTQALAKEILREIVIPVLEKEVNEGKNFAPVRQIYNAMILASWFKLSLKQSLVGQIYADKSKVKGVDIDDKDAKLKIYEQYLAAFKKGAVNMIREETDVLTNEILPRKYFSGGFTTGDLRAKVESAMVRDPKNLSGPDAVALAAGNVLSETVDLTQTEEFAMAVESAYDIADRLRDQGYLAKTLVSSNKKWTRERVSLAKAASAAIVDIKGNKLKSSDLKFSFDKETGGYVFRKLSTGENPNGVSAIVILASGLDVSGLYQGAAIADDKDVIILDIDSGELLETMKEELQHFVDVTSGKMNPLLNEIYGHARSGTTDLDKACQKAANALDRLKARFIRGKGRSKIIEKQTVESLRDILDGVSAPLSEASYQVAVHKKNAVEELIKQWKELRFTAVMHRTFGKDWNSERAMAQPEGNASEWQPLSAGDLKDLKKFVALRAELVRIFKEEGGLTLARIDQITFQGNDQGGYSARIAEEAINKNDVDSPLRRAGNFMMAVRGNESFRAELFDVAIRAATSLQRQMALSVSAPQQIEPVNSAGFPKITLIEDGYGIEVLNADLNDGGPFDLSGPREHFRRRDTGHYIYQMLSLDRAYSGIPTEQESEGEISEFFKRLKEQGNKDFAKQANGDAARVINESELVIAGQKVRALDLKTVFQKSTTNQTGTFDVMTKTGDIVPLEISYDLSWSGLNVQVSYKGKDVILMTYDPGFSDGVSRLKRDSLHMEAIGVNQGIAKAVFERLHADHIIDAITNSETIKVFADYSGVIAHSQLMTYSPVARSLPQGYAATAQKEFVTSAAINANYYSLTYFQDDLRSRVTEFFSDATKVEMTFANPLKIHVDPDEQAQWIKIFQNKNAVGKLIGQGNALLGQLTISQLTGRLAGVLGKDVADTVRIQVDRLMELGKQLPAESAMENVAPSKIKIINFKEQPVTITDKYAKIGNIILVRPGEMDGAKEVTDANSIVIQLEGLEPSRNSIGGIFPIRYGRGTIAIIKALQSLKDQIGSEEFNKFVWLDAGAGTGILGIVAAKLGAKVKVVAVEGGQEYEKLLERSERDSSTPQPKARPENVIKRNIELNGLEGQIEPVFDDLNYVDLKSRGVNGLIGNMAQYSESDFGNLFAKLINENPSIKAAFISGEPTSKTLFYSTMLPSDRYGFINSLNRVVDGFGEVLYTLNPDESPWPALFYSFVAPPKTDPSGAHEGAMEKADLGGIDLTADRFNLQIRRDKNGVALPVLQQVISNINIEGFYPVIIHIKPVTDMKELLGFDAAEISSRST